MIPVEHRRARARLKTFDAAFVLGLLVGEGHFGGDGRQPHIVLRMHVRHEPIFRWLQERFPYAKLYGPYSHDGRNYFQMMWRGTQLRYGLMPWLEACPWEEIDPHSYARYTAMKDRYGLNDVPSFAVPELHGSLLPSDALGETESEEGDEPAFVPVDGLED